MRCIVLFTKAPVPGKVKTRLTTHLTNVEAAHFHEAFVRDTLAVLMRLNGIEKFIAAHPGGKNDFFKMLTREYGVRTIDQGPGNLGDRLKRVLGELSLRGFNEVVAIGSDSPTLPVERIDAAFGFLGGSSLVIGPSLDGGYYLIGFSGGLPAVFDGISWGRETVFEETLRIAGEKGLSPAILPYWYDVDTMQELRFLALHLEGLSPDANRETRRVMISLKDKIFFHERGDGPLS